MRHVCVAVLFVAVAGGAASAQDIAAGERVFTQCRSCHQVGPTAKNVIGPMLNGLIGRKAGTYPGFSYSEANRNSGLTWDEATFRDYIRDPKAKMPNNKMLYAGLKNDQQITDLLAFLKSYDASGAKITN